MSRARRLTKELADSVPLPPRLRPRKELSWSKTMESEGAPSPQREPSGDANDSPRRGGGTRERKRRHR